MLKLASRRAAIVLAGGGLALAGGLVPAQASSIGWRTDATVAIRGNSTILTSVTAVSGSDAWATGLSANPKGTSLQTVIRHWNGKTWRSVTLPVKIRAAWAKEGPFITQVGASSARSAWIFGGFTGAFLRLDGSRWRLGRLPGGGTATSGAMVQIDAVKVFSGTNVWAFGERDSFSGTQTVTSPYAAHYNGRRWSRVTVPGLASGGGAITAVGAVSSSEMWAAESVPSGLGLATQTAATRRVATRPVATRTVAGLAPAARAAGSTPTAPVVLQYTASAGWHVAAVQPPLAATDQLSSAVADPGGTVRFGGSAQNTANGAMPIVAKWNGAKWSVTELLPRASSDDWQVASMTADGHGGVWALIQDNKTGATRIWHQAHGGVWGPVRPAFGKHQWALLALAQVPRTRSVWAVGAVQASKSTANGLIAVTGPLPR